MARKPMIAENKRPVKHSAQVYTRCECCGRLYSVCRKFYLCCICSREFTYKSQILGAKKTS